jgi:acyl-coenzyme A synthetase/AMP-(fatty) acid ligase
MTNIYDTHAGEVFWAASDVGWVVGHSYIVYGPLIQGCTTILFEGKPVKTPDSGTFFRVIEEYGVKTFFTAPTAFRAIKKEDPRGEYRHKYSLQTLQYLFLAGERCDAATLEWAQDLLGVPVIDHWWQTESGFPMLANCAGYGLFPVKPGSAGKTVPGFNIHILNPDGSEGAYFEEGAVAIKLPLPPGCLPTLWNNDEGYQEAYLSQFEGYYFTGDGGYKDPEHYVFITGRIDDVINVAGHRLSTAEMEEIVASHAAVAECAVIGIHCEMKGQQPVGFVVLKAGESIDDATMEKELVGLVREKIGAVASFRRAVVVKRLPKTRSGKILRKTMRSIADGQPYSAPSTIEDPDTLIEIAESMLTHKVGVAFGG